MKPLRVQVHVLLRHHDAAEIERARPQHDRDQDEPDRDFVTDHLRRRAQRRVEGVFRIRCPAGQDDPVDAERRGREDVQQPDIDVGQHHARLERHHRPDDQRDREGDDRRDQEQRAIGRGGDDRFLQEHLQPVGEALHQPERPDDVGPATQRHRRPDLAIGIDDHRDRQHQREGDDEDADDRGDEPRPAIGQADRGVEERGHATLRSPADAGAQPEKASRGRAIGAAHRAWTPAFAGERDVNLMLIPPPPRNPVRGPIPPNTAASWDWPGRSRWSDRNP